MTGDEKREPAFKEDDRWYSTWTSDEEDTNDKDGDPKNYYQITRKLIGKHSRGVIPDGKDVAVDQSVTSVELLERVKKVACECYKHERDLRELETDAVAK